MEYGKFNSVEELLKGYEELEKSFTQKCQQLSALEKMIEESGTNGTPSPLETTEQSVANDAVDTVPTPVDADGSQQVNQSEVERIPPRVMTGGGNVSCALPNRPKTLKEASDLAKKYFK